VEGEAQRDDLDPRLEAEDADEVRLRVVLGTGTGVRPPDGGTRGRPRPSGEGASGAAAGPVPPPPPVGRRRPPLPEWPRFPARRKLGHRQVRGDREPRCAGCRLRAVQAGSCPGPAAHTGAAGDPCQTPQGGWGTSPEPPSSPALTSRSDMGVLSSSGRCCSSARTMQLAMMVAKIMYSKGVRPSQGKPGWAEPVAGWGPPNQPAWGNRGRRGAGGVPKGKGGSGSPAPARLAAGTRGPAVTSTHVLRGSLISPSKARPSSPGSSARSRSPGRSRQ